ncbi:MAG: glycosyltransferase [Clostridia bacterium]|nr:glycosyltransferase [Clostridia bacterium]
MDQPLVSVFSIAYKQEKYIRQCLDGFVMQETNFPFEVIINDDASPDSTAAIIREYEEKYPDIIKPIYQTENQYSRHVRLFQQVLFPRARGKYIAFCEGDDFWTDPHKLQRQVDAMEANPDCGMCSCRIGFANEDGSSMGKSMPRGVTETGKIDSRTFIGLLYDFNLQFSGVMVRRDMLGEYYTQFPLFWRISDVGDEPLFLYFAGRAPVYIVNEEMSCYRTNSIGSWGNRTVFKASGNEKAVRHYKRMCTMCEEYDRYTNFVYHDLMEKKKTESEYFLNMVSGNYKALLGKKFRYRFKKMSFTEKGKLVVKAILPKRVTAWLAGSGK